jgi:redox-sensitive bicupin YhaK (pirin superfamily)
MIVVRPSGQRGHFNHGWLDTYHTFSFGDYYDPRQMGFRALRVINEDVVRPGAGFGMHGHRDMEIVTYVLSGTLRHEDSLGNGSEIRPGEVQRITAGTGVLHSEVNPSGSEPVHLLQIWLRPDRPGRTPGYEQKVVDLGSARGGWALIASNDGRGGSVTVHQDVALSVAALEPGSEARYDLRPGRHAWVQVVRGAVALNGQPLRAGDGAAVSDEALLTVRARDAGAAEVLLFDLA